MLQHASICKLMGANIYFCDVEKDTFQASKKNILDCIKKYKLKSIKVIFAMHLGGAAINSEEIYKIKKKNQMCYYRRCLSCIRWSLSKK